MSNILGIILKLMYDFIGNYAWAIIAFTIFVKTAMLPLTIAQNKSMDGMNEIQPKLKEIQEKYKGNPEKLNALTMELYKEHNVNPLMGCLPLLIQMPIIFALFNVLRNPVKYVFTTEAAFAATDQAFFWLKNMTVPDVIIVGGIVFPFILPCLAAISTYFDTKFMQGKQAEKTAKEKEKAEKNGKPQPQRPPSQMETTNKVMLYMMPIMILIWGIKFPAGLSLYWAVSNIYSIIQRRIFHALHQNKEKSKEAVR
ncbi:MAG: YidC/Oxa1 family membrane protein insertase [Filifactoraceae bacterium]